MSRYCAICHVIFLIQAFQALSNIFLKTFDNSDNTGGDGDEPRYNNPNRLDLTYIVLIWISLYTVLFPFILWIVRVWITIDLPRSVRRYLSQGVNCEEDQVQNVQE